MTEQSAQEELAQRAEQRIGQVLKGKYRLDHVLGIGGMAVVYAATHRNQKRVAVKMLHLELSFAGNVRARFLREGYVANTVDHPGALTVLDDDVSDDGAAFLVMELLEGKALDAIAAAKGSALPEALVLAIGEQLLDVLARAHEKAIVHRDIKPANVFVTRDGTLKVLDFGIARLRDAAPQDATGTGVVLGTPAYMPPEQAYGRTGEIDGQSDVWAAGATLFQLLTGRSVHGGGTASEILIRAATVPATPLLGVRADVHPRVAEIVDRALAFDKSARWATAGAMRDAIRDVLKQSFPTQAGASKLALAELVGEMGELSTRPSPLVVATADTQAAPSVPEAVKTGGGAASGAGAAAPSSVQASGAMEAVTAGPVTRSTPPRGRPPALVRAALAGVAMAVAVAGAGVLLFNAVTRPSHSVARSLPPQAESAIPQAIPQPSSVPSGNPTVATPEPSAPTPASATSTPSSAPPKVAPLPEITRPTPPASAAAPTKPTGGSVPSLPRAATSAAPRPTRPAAAPKPSDDDLFHP